MELIQFKYARLKDQFDSPSVDSRLKDIVYWLASWCWYNLEKSIIITHILRTQEQQDAIYNGNASYVREPWQSVHQYGRGVDLSVKYYTQVEIARIQDTLNKKFLYNKEGKNTCVVHDVGLGEHIHIQVDNSTETKFVKI